MSKSEPKKRRAKAKPISKLDESGLTPQQKMFALEYIKDWNATRAAKEAGYSENTATEQASRLLTNVKIQAFIKEFVDTHGMSAAEVLMRLAEHARGSFLPFLPLDDFMTRGEAPKLDLTTEQARENLHLVKKLKTKTRTSLKEDDEWEEVEVEVTIHDAQSALEKLGRYHKLFTDKTELTGKDGGDIILRVVYADDVESDKKQ